MHNVQVEDTKYVISAKILLYPLLENVFPNTSFG